MIKTRKKYKNEYKKYNIKYKYNINKRKYK